MLHHRLRRLERALGVSDRHTCGHDQHRLRVVFGPLRVIGEPAPPSEPERRCRVCGKAETVVLHVRPPQSLEAAQ